MEKDHIERVLQEMGGNMTRSARVLGIDRATLYNKVKRYGIRR
jgi:transcriptional regulator of acetoin/glycerol metabolism